MLPSLNRPSTAAAGRAARILAIVAAAVAVAGVAAGPARAGYVTYMFGRAQLGTYVEDTNCTTPVAGDVSLWRIADMLRAHGVAATAPVSIATTGETQPVCQGVIKNATWAHLRRLRDEYGWSVVSRGKSGNVLLGMTAAEQRDEICGSLKVFREHGFPEASGMFAYPGNDSTLAMQTGPVADCYAFGRKYGGGSNTLPVQAPYWARTNSVMGGRCIASGRPCSTMTVTNDRQYTNPNDLIAWENGGGWTIIQWYRFVEGASGTPSSTAPAWDCTASDPRLHWTNVPEMYCLVDARRVVARRAATTQTVSPAGMAAVSAREGTDAAREAVTRP